MKKLLMILLTFQCFVISAQTNADLLLKAIETNNPAMILDSLDIDTWDKLEKKMAFQYFEDFIKIINEENLTSKKLKGDKAIHFMKEDRVFLLCDFTNKDEGFVFFNFGPFRLIRHLKLPSVRMSNSNGNTSLHVSRKPIIPEHDLLADFDKAMKTKTLDKKFIFAPATHENLENFKSIYYTKNLMLPTDYQINDPIRVSYLRDEHNSELTLSIFYKLIDDKYHVSVFGFVHTPEKEKVKDNSNHDGELIEEKN